MGNPFQLQDRSLNNIMNSMSFGVVTSKGDGAVRKSALFDGLAQIRSKFSGDYQKANIQARTDFANSVIKEFGIERDSSIGKKLELLYTGDNKTKPLSIRDAQEIISIFGKQRELTNENIQNFKTFNVDQLIRIAKATLSDPNFFSEEIGVTSKGMLKNELVRIRDKTTSDPMPEMVNKVQNWLRIAGKEPTPELAKAIIKELGL